MRAEKKKGDVSIACFLIRWAAHCYYENGCHCFRVVIAVFRNLLLLLLLLNGATASLSAIYSLDYR